MNGITDMSLCALVDALDGKKLSAAEATRACLDRIKATEDRKSTRLNSSH